MLCSPVQRYEGAPKTEDAFFYELDVHETRHSPRTFLEKLTGPSLSQYLIESASNWAKIETEARRAIERRLEVPGRHVLTAQIDFLYAFCRVKRISVSKGDCKVAVEAASKEKKPNELLKAVLKVRQTVLGLIETDPGFHRKSIFKRVGDGETPIVASYFEGSDDEFDPSSSASFDSPSSFRAGLSGSQEIELEGVDIEVIDSGTFSPTSMPRSEVQRIQPVRA